MSVFECIGYRLSGRVGAALAEKKQVRALVKTWVLYSPSFRGDAKHRTRNLEIPGSSFGRPGMT